MTAPLAHCVWRIEPDADRYGRVDVDDLEYFRTHFVGSSMEAQWQPPTLRLMPTRRKQADFVPWAGGVLLCSVRAKAVLSPLLRKCVEWLPCSSERGEVYFALNVLEIGDQLVDLPATKSLNSGHPAGFLLSRVRFLPQAAVSAPPIFRLRLGAPIPRPAHYVSSEVAASVAREQLKGIWLMNPERDEAMAYIRGEQMNDFPGIKT